MAFALFRHAIKLVLTNWRAALKISALPYLVQVAILLAFEFVHPAIGANAGSPGSGGAPASFIGLVIGGFIAVGWHRFVLLDETPSGYVPTLNSARVMRYVGKLLLISLIVVAIEAVGIVAVMLLWSSGAPIVAVAVGIVFFLALAVVGLRLGAILPAAAVDVRLTFREAWEATKGTVWLTMRLGLLCAVGVVALLIPLLLYFLVFGRGAPAIGADVLADIAAWFLLMVGVALLTTMYGYYIEHRPIEGLPARPGSEPPLTPAPTAGA